MNYYYMLMFCLFNLVRQSMEDIKDSPMSVDTNQTTTTATSTDTGRLMEDDNSTAAFPKEDGERERSAYSRMLALQKLFTSTTTIKPTPYNYWWYFTTPRRPLISYRDYPGKPGVATWKEISPIGEKESKKVDPTAAGVLSSAHWWHSSSSLLVILICITWMKFMMNS